MKTIRTKIALIFAVFMFFLVLCGILLNVLFLQSYYIYKNKGIFISANKRITEEYTLNRVNITSFIELIDRVEGISCIITDRYQNIEFNSFRQKPDPDARRLPGEIEQLVTQNEDELNRNYIYSVIEKLNDQAPKLIFISRLDNGELIILRKPLKGISESVTIANQFYILAGLLIILVGGVFIFVFSKAVTRPVIEMSNVAESISNMDFDKRVIYNSDDEIGSLGKSINKISENLSTSMNTLKQDVERRKQLVRNVSHELKTPIGVIKGYAEGLKFGVAEDKDTVHKYCATIAEECNRMDNMVRELPNLSMLESGVFQINTAVVDIKELILEISEKFKPVFIEKGITFDFIAGNNLVASADRELLERAVNNYITNAINHTEGIKHIRITAEMREDMIRISVYNTGKHMPVDDIENIWDVFYKIDKARSRQYGGHGLGLSIVKLIAELHGGIAGVKNADEGVLFFIDIPQNL